MQTALKGDVRALVWLTMGQNVSLADARVASCPCFNAAARTAAPSWDRLSSQTHNPVWHRQAKADLESVSCDYLLSRTRDGPSVDVLVIVSTYGAR